MKISIENIQNGVDAETTFLGLLCRLVKDGELTNSRTAFFPLYFSFENYVDVEVDQECTPDVDQEVLRLGAFLACIIRMYDLASADQIGTAEWHTLSSAVTRSEFLSSNSFPVLADLLSGNNLGLVEDQLAELFHVHVMTWWKGLAKTV